MRSHDPGNGVSTSTPRTTIERCCTSGSAVVGVLSADRGEGVREANVGGGRAGGAENEGEDAEEERSGRFGGATGLEKGFAGVDVAATVADGEDVEVAAWGGLCWLNGRELERR